MKICRDCFEVDNPKKKIDKCFDCEEIHSKLQFCVFCAHYDGKEGLCDMCMDDLLNKRKKTYYEEAPKDVEENEEPILED